MECRRPLPPLVPRALLALLLLVASGCGEGREEQGALQVLETPADGEDGDVLVLKHMREAGADLTRATDVRWYVYFPSQVGAETFARVARDDGWTVDVRPGADDESWLALCSRDAIVSLETIRAQRAQFAAWSAGLDADIDGWEAAITK
jgi:hypothetical protein